MLLVLRFVTACGGATRTGGPEEGTGGGENTGGTGSARNTGGTATNTGGSRNTGGTATTMGGASGVLSAKDYIQGCVVDANCTLVTEGPRCSCAGCPNASINMGDFQRWYDAMGACPPMTCPEVICEEVLPACSDGICTPRRAHYITGRDFDRSCSTNTDCVLIPTGEYCAGCSCGRAGVSKKGYEQYLAQTSTFEPCNPERIDCDCAVPTAAVCLPQPAGEGRVCDVSF